MLKMSLNWIPNLFLVWFWHTQWINRCVSVSTDNMATAVWVWDMQKVRLEAVLEQTSSVRCFQWDPRRPRLALCTGNSKLYLWSPGGCVSVQVPAEGNFS